jgi:hypothetical protein
MKKVLSLVLVIAMVLSSMSFAFAGTFEDIADTDYEKAINTLAALKVIDGYDDGTFKPEKTITRAEMAKLLVQLLGYGDLVAGSKSNFSDTQGHWADPWIALAAGKGLVIGTGDGKFTPDRTVSYDEVLTMLVRGLGYTDDCNEIKGIWPSNFKVKAAELGITKNVKINSDGADRGGVAQAMFNALEAKIVTVDSDKNVKDVVDGKGKTRQLLSRIAELDENYTVSSDLLDPNNKNYAGNYVDLAPYMYQNLEVYLNDDDEVVFIKDINSLVIEGTVDEVTAASNGKSVTVAVELEDGSIKKVNFTTDASNATDALKEKVKVSVFENRANRSAVSYEYLEDTETIKIVAIEDENKSNGKIEENEIVGLVLETQTSVIRVEEEYSEGDLTLDGLTLPTNSKNKVDLTKILVKGDADSLEDIKVDDVVVEYLAEDDEFTTLVVTRNTVNGTVTRQGGTDVYIDGVKYKLSETPGAISAPEVNDEGVFYLDHNGKIVDFDGEGVSATDYAIVIGTEAGTIDSKFGKKSIDDYPQIKLVNQEGEEIVYDLLIKLNSNGDKVTSSVKVNGSSLFDDSDLVASGEFAKLKVQDLVGENPQESIIKYSLNKDNKVSKIETVTAQFLEDVDTTKSSFKLASNALVFDAKEAEAVSADKLRSEIDGYAVYNKKGEIEVLVTNDIDQAKYTFAYITKIQAASKDGDSVLAAEAYVNGKKVDPLYTDSDDVFTKTDGKYTVKVVYALDMNNEVVEDAIVVTTSSGIIGGKILTVYEGKIQERGNNTVKINDSWYTLADDATIIGVDSSDNSVNAVRKLNSIRADKTDVQLYIYDGYVSFVVIYE